MQIILDLDPMTAHQLTWLCLMKQPGWASPREIIAPLISEQYRELQELTPTDPEMRKTVIKNDQ